MGLIKNDDYHDDETKEILPQYRSLYRLPCRSIVYICCGELWQGLSSGHKNSSVKLFLERRGVNRTGVVSVEIGMSTGIPMCLHNTALSGSVSTRSYCS